MEVTRQNDPEITRARQRFSIIGNAPALTQAIERAIRVAPIDLSVLVTGESGSGKEFFPKIIHAYSPRKHAKYIAVNCGAIPEGTIDSELFGHEKGSFTGAVASRKGYFEEADGGTIFLDEVAELPLTTQARLLRVLETGEYLRVGSSEVRKTNIRVVAATNVDMQRAVEEGRFREDLFYRLSTVTITVPPLRDRGNDIRLLARKFSTDFAQRYRTPELELSDEAMNVLMAYRWPGNVRQLKNIIEQVSLFEGGKGTVSATTLNRYMPSGAGSNAPALTGQRVYSYQEERDILFNMIMRMQRRLDDVTAELNALRRNDAHHTAPAPGNGTLIKSDASLTEHILPRFTTSSDNRYHGFEDATPVEAEEVVPEEQIPASPASGSDTPRTLEDTERRTIAEALERNDGRRKATAKELNISERTLYRKIREYGLE